MSAFIQSNLMAHIAAMCNRKFYKKINITKKIWSLDRTSTYFQVRIRIMILMAKTWWATIGKGMPDPNLIHPIYGYDKLIYAKPNIIIQIISLSVSLPIPDSEFESHTTH